MQAWVAAGLGVATQTGLSLRAHHIEGVVATELPGFERHIYAATYGEPPDPPATAALLAALAEAATSAVTSSGQNLPRPAAPLDDRRGDGSHAGRGPTLERLKPGRDTVEPVVMPFSDADPAVSRKQAPSTPPTLRAGNSVPSDRGVRRKTGSVMCARRGASNDTRLRSRRYGSRRLQRPTRGSRAGRAAGPRRRAIGGRAATASVKSSSDGRSVPFHGGCCIKPGPSGAVKTISG
jgi:hypothetical protein